MRLALLIRDIEYRRALIERISDFDNDILLDVINTSDPIEPDALIITDAKPAELDIDLLNKIRHRTVFLYTGAYVSSEIPPLHTVFKYNSFSRLLAEISDKYNGWQGIKLHKSANSKVIACCTDSDAFSTVKCSKLAAQIIYIYGGSVLLLPLSYINEDAADYGKDINRFARLMYTVKSGRELSPYAISYTDSYGISRLMLPRGRNPIAYLDGEDLDKLIMSVSKTFDTVILDIATCYREENLTAIKNADSLICFETGRRRMNWHGLTKSENDNKMKIVKTDLISDEAYATDEFIRELYGISHGNQL